MRSTESSVSTSHTGARRVTVPNGQMQGAIGTPTHSGNAALTSKAHSGACCIISTSQTPQVSTYESPRISTYNSPQVQIRRPEVHSHANTTSAYQSTHLHIPAPVHVYSPAPIYTPYIPEPLSTPTSIYTRILRHLRPAISRQYLDISCQNPLINPHQYPFINRRHHHRHPFINRLRPFIDRRRSFTPVRLDVSLLTFRHLAQCPKSHRRNPDRVSLNICGRAFPILLGRVKGQEKQS